MESSEGFDGPDVVFPQGYDALTKGLATDLDVRLNTWVSAIRYDAEMAVVETSQGNFEADYVVVTVPLGVLKKGKIAFTPELPEAKVQAIEGLDMGIMNKVYLKFDSVFWDNNVTNLGYIGEQRGEFGYWINLTPVVGEPVLVAFNVGEYAVAMEALSDDEIQQKTMTYLKAFFGNDIPQPTDRVITRWSKDEFSYGSYSYVPVGATASMRDDLAAPVDGKLFFAGEATHPTMASTVHGAYLTGEREADRIIALGR